MLKDYEDKFSKLLEKAAKDDDAKGDLEDYRNRQFRIRKKRLGNREILGRINWGLKKANKINQTCLKKMRKEFDEAIEKSQEAIIK